eukprot:107435-Amphidinium_carterae.1
MEPRTHQTSFRDKTKDTANKQTDPNATDPHVFALTRLDTHVLASDTPGGVWVFIHAAVDSGAIGSH